MAYRWMEYEGKRILYLNPVGFGEDLDTLAEELKAVTTIMAQEPEGSLLGLVDLQGVTLSKDLVDQVKGNLQEVGNIVGKSAVVVDKLSGFKKVILDAVARVAGRNVTLFESLEEAQDWLVSED